jgi:hypothetical protein
MINAIKSTPGLLISFVLMMLIGFGFSIWIADAGGILLDTVVSPDEARALIAGMSAEQREVHFWVTVLLDAAYPLAYGSFMAGLALRFFGGWGKWLSVPAFLTMAVDFAENTLQAMALKGVDLLGAKAVLTPMKFGLFTAAAVIALVALVWGIVGLVRRKMA